MVRSSRSRWLSGIGAVVLIGGLVLANYGRGATPAEATGTFVNPFPIIIDKLNQILAKLSTSGGEGNHTLRWDQNLPAAKRFVLLAAFNNEAVLDKNTGLVWERVPDAADLVWTIQTFNCINKKVGGTRGWRLPSVAELVSLIDPLLPKPFVPADIFPDVPPLGLFWSATTHGEDHTLAWDVGFQSGDVLNHPKTTPLHAWCVRGGMNADTY